MTGADEVLGRLRAYREHDAPTHGGRVLSYVYDHGRPELDELAAQAMRMLQPDLQLVVCGSSSGSMPTFGEWERVVLEHA